MTGKGITDAMVLAELRQGEYVSGAAIGRKLGVSRTSVSKHVANLRRAGYKVDAAGKLGTKLVRGPECGRATSTCERR